MSGENQNANLLYTAAYMFTDTKTALARLYLNKSVNK